MIVRRSVRLGTGHQAPELVEEITGVVQYHPEAAPGPHDARYLFDLFAELMDAS